MVHLDLLDPGFSTATAPTVCMHCVDPVCAKVCPAHAIQVVDGIVRTALKARCLDCRNCVLACPFGVPRYDPGQHLQMKCDQCLDRTSEGRKPMCAAVCPSGALTYGEYSEVTAKRRGKPVNTFWFGGQKVETNVFLMVPPEEDAYTFDLLEYAWKRNVESEPVRDLAVRAGGV
jgi:Fe-S-cluster-containing dehydrogenase component